jgi:hypothetical protein
MTIDSADALISAMGNSSSRLIIEKASISNAAAGQVQSLWRATGQPGQGAIPTSVAVCDNTTVGCIGFTQQVAPATSYVGILQGLCANAGTTLELHDRLAHFGGLNGTLATAQTVNMDLSTLLATSNLDARKGDANYSDVSWWVEWYSDTGSPGVNVTVNAKFNDGTDANLTAFAIAATRRASSMIQLNTQIAAAQAGKYIRGINSVTLSVTTGTAGNFGVTATRFRAAMYKPVANARFTNNWADLGLPEVHNGSCIFPIQLASTPTTGVVRATGKIVHG